MVDSYRLFFQGLIDRKIAFLRTRGVLRNSGYNCGIIKNSFEDTIVFYIFERTIIF